MPTTTNSVPNQNDLFKIFQDQVKSIRALNDVIVKSKITTDVTENINKASKILVDSSKAIVDTLKSLPKLDDTIVENFNRYMARVSNIGVTMAGIIQVYAQFGTLDWLRAQFGIWRMRVLMRSIKRLIVATVAIRPISVLLASKVLKSVANAADDMAKMTRSLMGVPWFGIGLSGIQRMYRILYGHKPGKPKLPTDKGLVDIFIDMQRKSRLQYLIKANWAISLLINPTKKLIGVLALAGVALPLIAMSWLSIKLMKPIINTLLYIYIRIGRRLGRLIKGSIGMKLIVASLMLFLGGLVLVGALAILAYKPILIAVAVITGIILLFVTIGAIKILIKRGYRSIMYIAAAVALLGMVAVTMALLGQFISVNLAAFAMVTLYMLMLIGSFALIAVASRLIRKATWDLLIIVLAVSILAITAMLVAVVGQFISTNILSMIIVGLWMFAMVQVILMVGQHRIGIANSLEALLIVAGFTVVMTVIIGLLGLVSRMVNVFELIGVTITMALVILIMAGLAVGISEFQAEILAGVDALITIAVIAGIMAGVMLILAISVAIANPLLILAALGEMTLVVLAVGALAIAAGALVTGPQALFFTAGVAALTTIALVAALIGVCGSAIAGAAKKIQDAGFDSAEEMATMLNLPFKALIRGDGTESLFNILSSLPNVKLLVATMVKMGMLSQIVSSVGNMADILSHIASLTMPDPNAGYDPKTGNPLGYKQMKAEDFAAAAWNASVILRMAVDMFGDEDRDLTLADGTSVTIKAIKMDTLGKVMPRVKRKINRLSKIVGYVGSMADTLQHIASLNMPDPNAGYDENGRPLKYKQMGVKDFGNAAMNAGSILQFFANLWDDKGATIVTSEGPVNVVGISTSVLDNIMPRTKRKIKRLGVMINAVGGMADTLQKLSMLVIPDVTGSDDYNENGTPKKWRQMTKDDIRDAALAAGALLQFFGNLFGEKDTTMTLGKVGNVEVHPLTGAFMDSMTRATKRKVERMGTIISTIGGMAQILQNLSNMVVPDASGPEDYNEDGTPKKWRQMNESDITNAMNRAQSLLVGVAGILGDDAVTEKLKEISKRNIKKLGVAMESIQGLVGVMDIVKAIAGGRMAVRWEVDNNPNSPTYGQEVPVDYINLSEFLEKNSDKVNSTIEKLIMCPITAVSVISKNKDYMEKIKSSSKNVDAITGMLQKIKDPITGIIELYNDKLANAKPDEMGEIYRRIIQSSIDPFLEYSNEELKSGARAMSVFEQVMVAITGGKTTKGTQVNGLQQITSENSKNFQTNVKEVNALIKQVGSTDINKLKYASNLMSKMAQFSASINGNFKELSKTISQDLIEAIQKLNECLEKINEEGIQTKTTTSTEQSDGKPNPFFSILSKSGTPGAHQTIVDRQSKATNTTSEDSPVKILKDIRNMLDSVIDNDVAGAGPAKFSGAHINITGVVSTNGS